MDGELCQLARLVLYVKDSMISGSEKKFKLDIYENRLFFSFLPINRDFVNKSEDCDDALKWYMALRERGIKDIWLINFFDENDIRFAGFSNSAKQGFFTEYKDGKTTFWDAKWEFDKLIQSWTIYYKEFEWTGNKPAKFTFLECRDNFSRVLLDIDKLAYTLGFDNFANIFNKAYDILTGNDISPIPEWVEETMPTLKGEQLKLFLASCEADVFGGMGSWNDIPYCLAYEKGLKEDYDRLSKELYISIKKAVMNAVNSNTGR